jgi:hypothetical protein
MSAVQSSSATASLPNGTQATSNHSEEEDTSSDSDLDVS